MYPLKGSSKKYRWPVYNSNSKPPKCMHARALPLHASSPTAAGHLLSKRDGKSVLVIGASIRRRRRCFVNQRNAAQPRRPVIYARVHMCNMYIYICRVRVSRFEREFPEAFRFPRARKETLVYTGLYIYRYVYTHQELCFLKMQVGGWMREIEQRRSGRMRAGAE